MKVAIKLTMTAVGAFLFIAALAVLNGTGCRPSSTPATSPQTTNAVSQTRQYTCSMHPEVVQDQPGKCPKCGMELVEKK
jgi:hypothetical protein